MGSNVNDINEAYQWSISHIARVFSMDRKTVSRRLEGELVRPAGTRAGYPVYALKDVAPALFGHVMVGGQEPNDMTPPDRRAWYQSENDRLKFEVQTGQLVPTHDVRLQMSTLAKATANTLESLPDILERDCGLSAEALDRVQDVIDSHREQMYRVIIAQEADEATASSDGADQ
jgi:hypothetical protein